MSQITKTDEYVPTAAEKKLLNVMLNPENVTLNVTEVCAKAGVSRDLYYTAIGKEGFRKIMPDLSRQLVSGSILQVVQAFVREAKKGSFPHGKTILEMAELVSREGGIPETFNQQNNFYNLTDEQLDQLIQSKLKQTGVSATVAGEAEENTGESA